MTTSDAAIGRSLVAEARSQLAQSHRKIEHCLGQLSDEQLWHRAGENFNSIANLVLHLAGNISQRMLAVVGGEPDVRDRAAEFAERGPIAKAELWARFDDAVRRSDALLASLAPERLIETRRYRMLRGEVENTVLGVIVQTLVHVGGHTQEIVALTRLQLREVYQFLESSDRR
jgi:hypothetical protein